MNRSLPLLVPASPRKSPSQRLPELVSELQSLGMRWQDRRGPGLSRSGGAGPSDHKAVSLDGQTIMVPIFTHASRVSPYTAEVDASGSTARLLRAGAFVTELRFPREPRFYALSTAAGVPYWKIARLHGQDVLATTVLQTCTRYGNRASACQFCGIGQSLAGKSTLAEKSPDELAEVARAAVELDGVRHAVLTTGTPATTDRGAAVLASCARSIRAAVNIPIQAQCEPPDDFDWFARLRAAGVDSLGMHLEAVTPEVRLRIMPGKAEVPLATYFDAFAAAVRVFGRGQVSTYILAGLGDTRAAILETSRALVQLGVYPFVVPFVPIGGTPLESHPTPAPAFMDSLLSELSAILRDGDMKSSAIKAGCGRCGACSSLRVREDVAHA